MGRWRGESARRCLLLIPIAAGGVEIDAATAGAGGKNLQRRNFAAAGADDLLGRWRR